MGKKCQVENVVSVYEIQWSCTSWVKTDIVVALWSPLWRSWVQLRDWCLLQVINCTVFQLLCCLILHLRHLLFILLCAVLAAVSAKLWLACLCTVYIFVSVNMPEKACLWILYDLCLICMIWILYECDVLLGDIYIFFFMHACWLFLVHREIKGCNYTNYSCTDKGPYILHHPIKSWNQCRNVQTVLFCSRVCILASELYSLSQRYTDYVACNCQADYRLFKGVPVPVICHKFQCPEKWRELTYSPSRGLEC